MHSNEEYIELDSYIVPEHSLDSYILMCVEQGGWSENTGPNTGSGIPDRVPPSILEHIHNKVLRQYNYNRENGTRYTVYSKRYQSENMILTTDEKFILH